MSQRKIFTKSDLIEVVCKSYKNLTHAQAKRIVQCVFDSISTAMTNKKRVEIRGFGTFGLKSYDARLGKNPQTGETIQVKPKVLPFFKAGKLRKNISKH